LLKPHAPTTKIPILETVSPRKQGPFNKLPSPPQCIRMESARFSPFFLNPTFFSQQCFFFPTVNGGSFGLCGFYFSPNFFYRGPELSFLPKLVSPPCQNPPQGLYRWTPFSVFSHPLPQVEKQPHVLPPAFFFFLSVIRGT